MIVSPFCRGWLRVTGRSSSPPAAKRRSSAALLDPSPPVRAEVHLRPAESGTSMLRLLCRRIQLLLSLRGPNRNSRNSMGSQCAPFDCLSGPCSAGICSFIRSEDGVAEFRGPAVHGLVRFAQMSELESQIEATFDGLTPGLHSWSVNEYGDVREGAASTGLPYSRVSTSTGPSVCSSLMIPCILDCLRGQFLCRKMQHHC